LRKIGRKGTPFNADIRAKMMSAFGFLDILLTEGIEPFSRKGLKKCAS
jgi:hypothetical protein